MSYNCGQGCGWDGQPRAVVSVEGGLCQCPLVASPGKEVKRKQGKGKNQLEGTKQCKTISKKILQSPKNIKELLSEQEIGKEDGS